ncbi:ABC transporter substrate-binding protein [Laspinema sp. A4]|uniref:ABC transporter substrate-binding protein n=1 Tax=Laspinema sp. D2d TaxID=2953686 RepID=UPI0021BA4D1E|nr:ABC transporter substrate-binding protein [Laspinema sp. D2d]MCT7982312.1 ABC transporter substrate-binding protein [Laspinema sp. D2d]
MKPNQTTRVNYRSITGSIRGAIFDRHWRKWAKFVGLFSMCCLLAISCGDRPGMNQSSDPNRISIGTTAKIRTIDPADAYENAAGMLLYNLGDRLYTYESGTTTLKPQLATALPQISPDGVTYTIPLRSGVLYHDGTPFNAETMKFSLQRFMENGGSPSSLLSNIVESVAASGEYELTLKLKQPFAAFSDLLTFSGLVAVSPTAYQIGAGQFKPDTFVGTGPYKLVSYGTDSIKLDVFEDYWGEKPINTGIDIQQFSSPANVYNSFRRGAVDLTYGTLDLDQITSLEKQAPGEGWQVISNRSNGVYVLTLNMKDEALKKPEVRQAIASIIDRPLLQQRIFQGQMEPLYSLIPTTLERYYQPVFKEKYGDGNFAQAKQLLTQAGYTPENPLQLQLWYRSNLRTNADVAATIKAVAEQELGGALQIQLQSVEAATAYNNLDKGVYSMFILDWTPDFFDPDNYINPFLSCAKGSVETGCEEGETKLWGSFYYSDRVNQLIARERQEQNPETRRQIFTELQQIISEDVPFIPLWQGKEYLFARKGIQGATLESTQAVPFGTLKK